MPESIETLVIFAQVSASGAHQDYQTAQAERRYEDYTECDLDFDPFLFTL